MSTYPGYEAQGTTGTTPVHTRIDPVHEEDDYDERFLRVLENARVRLRSSNFVQLGDVTVNIHKVVRVYRDSRDGDNTCYVDIGTANDFPITMPLERATRLLNFQEDEP